MRWEYTTFGVRITGSDSDSEDIRRQLNEYGADGWELVSVIGTESMFLGTGRTGMVVGFFKRPLVGDGGNAEPGAAADGGGM